MTFLARLLAAFQVRAYRWLWSGHFLYVMSLVMSHLALGWLMLELTNSPYWVGVATGVGGVGKIISGFFAGVLVDRLDKRRVLMGSQFFYGLLALILGALILADRVMIWNVLVIAFLLGATDAVVAPASNTIVYQVVGRERVMNASAINMMGFNTARTLGAALAGILIDRADTGTCYLAASGLACVGVLPMLGIHGVFRAPGAPEAFWRALRDGVKHVWQEGALRRALGLSVVVEMFGFSHYTMTPVIARDVLRVGAQGLGYLSAASGLGATLGTLALASLGDFKHKARLMWITTLCAGVGIILFALSPWYGVSLLLATFNGATLASYDALMQTLVQLLTPDAVRGRVLSLYVLTFGFTSVGGYVAGVVATAASAPFAIGLGGGVIVIYLLGIIKTMRHMQPTVR